MRQKRTIDIKTLNGYFNYGNRLQVFALSKVITGLNRKVLIYWPKTKVDSIKEFFKAMPPLCLKYKKETKLYWFTRKYVPRSTRKNREISVYGSDQVWNPEYLKERPYLLSDREKNMKVSYAASLGVTSFTPAQSDMFKDKLKAFNAISVREESAQKIIQPLSDRKIEVVLDPTLLLGRKDYTVLEKKPKGYDIDKKYILCYILGNRDHENAIRDFAARMGYSVIFFSDKHDSDYGIEEFLFLIDHAQLVCTDSFHACVFSLIFERPFVAFKRTGKENYMYTRLQNLIDTFKLENREFNGKEITKENSEVDYTEAKKILKEEQKKSLDFLKRALDIKDEN